MHQPYNSLLLPSKDMFTSLFRLLTNISMIYQYLFFLEDGNPLYIILLLPLLFKAQVSLI
jgi:hypothetical protein